MHRLLLTDWQPPRFTSRLHLSSQSLLLFCSNPLSLCPIPFIRNAHAVSTLSSISTSLSWLYLFAGHHIIGPTIRGWTHALASIYANSLFDSLPKSRASLSTQELIIATFASEIQLCSLSSCRTCLLFQLVDLKGRVAQNIRAVIQLSP